MDIKKLLFTCAFLSSTFLFSQDIKKSIFQFQSQTEAIVTVNENTGIAEFVKFPLHRALKLNGNTLQEKTINFLESYKNIFSSTSKSKDFVFEKTETDNFGLHHIVVKQQHKGVPVYDGKLHLHFNTSNELTSVNGNYIPNIKLNTSPTLSQDDANEIALKVVKDQGLNLSGETMRVNKSTLYVFQKGLVQGYLGAKYLVYEVEVLNELDVREFIFVNAHTGGIVEQFTGMAHALDRIVYEGNTSNVVWQEGNGLPGLLNIWQQNEVNASEHVYNFFNNAFGYVSYDGADAQMRTINNDPGISCPNANWNGVTANYCNGTASDDVIAHEWGHAYTQYTSGLIYAYQSGAMNESFSDIWGETIDLLNGYEDLDDDHTLRTSCNSSDRWRMGEDASAFGGAIRDMWNPPCNGDPGKVTDGQYKCGEADSGGVHSNSGIPNHAYALLVDGGAYNGQVINGIGFTKAAHIFWRAQSQYLTATSDFDVLADALEAAATDLIGLNLEGLSTAGAAGPSGEVITSADLTDVLNTILAVELRINPDSCGYTPILAPIAELCEASVSNPVFYEDWESGLNGWTVGQLPQNPFSWDSRDWVLENNLPNGRTGNGVFGIDPINGDCGADLENGIIRLESPVINIPDYPNGTFDMSFNHYVATETNWDGGNIKYSLNGGAWNLLPVSAFIENPYNSTINDTAAGNDNPMQGEVAFTGIDGGSVSGSWGTSVIDLSSIGVLPNSTVQFRFELGTDGCNGSEGWYLDEITIYNCSETLSVSEFDQFLNSLKVFPNPSNGVFTLQNTSGLDLVKADVYDINGRFIKQVDLSNMKGVKSIDLSEASSGMYFMSIQSKESKAVVKLIKE